MRVAIFTETFLPKMDGIVRVICLLADHLQTRGIEVMIIAPRLSDPPVTEYKGMKVVTIGGVPLPFYPELRFTPPSYPVYRAMQAFKPDIAHFIHPVTVGLPGMVFAKMQNIPLLTSFHLDFARIAQHMSVGPINLGFLRGPADYAHKLIFNWADYSLAPSRQVQTHMLNLGIKEVGLWKRGVDADTFHPRFYSRAMRERLSNGHPDDPILLYVGRLSGEKCVQHLRPVLDRVPNTRLAIVGDGPYRAELEKVFAGSNTVFTGYLLGEELSQAYASADIFTFPSSLETFGLVVVEAMAAGTPVVASQVGGIPDVVEEGVNGYTFPVGDIERLVAGVQKIVDDPAHKAQMSQNGRAFAETQTWEHMMDEVIVHYERIIREHQKN